MKYRGIFGASLLVCGLNLGCDPASNTGLLDPAPRTRASVEAVEKRRHDPQTSLARTFQPRLRAQDVRVLLKVVPGDAWVEVDDVPVRRRQGLIELVGHVGDVRRVRAIMGDRSTEEIRVRIGADGPSPAVIEAALVKPGTTKKRPVRFGNE